MSWQWNCETISNKCTKASQVLRPGGIDDTSFLCSFAFYIKHTLHPSLGPSLSDSPHTTLTATELVNLSIRTRLVLKYRKMEKQPRDFARQYAPLAHLYVGGGWGAVLQRGRKPVRFPQCLGLDLHESWRRIQGGERFALPSYPLSYLAELCQAKLAKKLMPSYEWQFMPTRSCYASPNSRLR